ncbi:MAG TPA: hypothetical protein VFX15_03645 [Actinomycetes bacterium]|nr:hypothetical protein [Actinomycetes bacterium]
MTDIRIADQPFDRATELGNDVANAFEASEHRQPNDRAIILIDTDDRCGCVLVNYPNDNRAQVIADMLMHLRALFNSIGKRLEFMALDDEGIHVIPDDTDPTNNQTEGNHQ